MLKYEAQHLSLTEAEVDAIETEAFAVVRKEEAQRKEYQQFYEKALNDSALSDGLRKEHLERFRQRLGLTKGEVETIQAEVDQARLAVQEKVMSEQPQTKPTNPKPGENWTEQATEAETSPIKSGSGLDLSMEIYLTKRERQDGSLKRIRLTGDKERLNRILCKGTKIQSKGGIPK